AGFTRRQAVRSASACAGPARSVLVRTTRSATATCFTDSGCWARCLAPLTASTVVTTWPTRKWCRSTGSASSVKMIGAGSARPVVSMASRSNLGIVPRHRPQRGQVLDDRGPAGPSAEDEAVALPVCERQAVMLEHLVGQPHAV